MAETVIIDVAITPQDAISRADQLGKSIREIKQEQTELKKANQENTAAYVSNAQSLRQLNQEQKSYVTLANNAVGSNNALRAQLSILTSQYNGLSREERDATIAGKSMQIQIRTISDELKKNESAVGDNRRNVGNYADAQKGLSEQLKNTTAGLNSLGGVVDRAPIGFKLLGDTTTSITSSFKAFNAASEEAKSAQTAFKEAEILSTQAQNAATAAMERATAIGFQFAAGTATQTELEIANTVATDANIVATEAQTVATEAGIVATNTSSASLKLLRVALISTGIGAIVVLLGSLIAYFTQTERGSEILERALGGLKGAFNVVLKPIIAFGEGIVNAFENPKQAGKDLLSFIEGQFVNRFKAIGKLAKAAFTFDYKGIIDGVTQLATGVENVGKKLAKFGKDVGKGFSEGANVAKLAQDAEDLVRDLNRQASKARADAAVLRAKGDAESLKQAEILLKKANRLTEQGVAAEVKAQQAKIKALEKVGQARDSDYDDLNALYAKADQSRQTDAAKAEKINTRLEKLAAKKAEAEEKSKKAQLDADAALAESLTRTTDLILTARQKEVNDLNANIDAKILKYKEYGKTTTQLEKERTAGLEAISKKFYESDIAIINSNIRQIQDIQVNSIKNEGERAVAQQALNTSRLLETKDKEIAETKDRISKGEEGLTLVLKTQTNARLAIETQAATERAALVDKGYAEDLAKYEQHLLDMAQAQVLAAGTDAEKLIAQQALLDLQRQQAIDHAIKLGEDTTLIDANFRKAQEDLDAKKNQTAVDSINAFGDAFQTVVGENTQAAKIAADVQTRINAGLALQNNILIIQEQIKALTKQGGLPFPFNIIAIFSTLAALTSAIASAKQLAKIPGLYEGGIFQSDGMGSMVRGAGSGKSDSINARLSNGESVINAKSTAMFAPILSAINIAGGGRELAPGYAMASGGIASGSYVTSISDKAFQQNDVNNSLIAAFRLSPRPVVGVEQIITSVNRYQQAQVRQDI